MKTKKFKFNLTVETILPTTYNKLPKRVVKEIVKAWAHSKNSFGCEFNNVELKFLIK